MWFPIYVLRNTKNMMGYLKIITNSFFKQMDIKVVIVKIYQFPRTLKKCGNTFASL